MQKLAALALCLVACGGGGGGPGGDDTVDNPDAGMDNTPVWQFNDVSGVPNLDDDDGQAMDWSQPPFPADDDYTTFTLDAKTLEMVPKDGSVELSMTGNMAMLKVYRDGTLVMGGTAGAGPLVVMPTGADIAFTVAFGDYNVAASMVVKALDKTGALKHETSLSVRSAPLIMNHHLQPAEHVWAVQVNGNASMLASFEAALGDKFTPVPGGSYGGDVWIQDEFEFATLTGNDGQRLDVVIDSIRNRGLDAWAENTQVGPDVIARTWGVTSQRTSYDSFGNLEASPPVEVGGVKYPFGKIYYGRVGTSATSGLSTQLAAFLASQQVQKPFELPTNWLCVGHVDEFSSFVPDPSSPKGFKLVIADVPSALATLQSLPSTASIGRYGNDHGYATVGAMLQDTALIALNNDIQQDYLDPILAKFKTELGLTDDDIIKAPSLFETVGGCNGRVAALIPGMVNLTIATVNGTTHLFTADPFFRATGAAQSSDPIVAAFTQKMPQGTQLHFVDDWNVYHLGLGEVHCGSNVKRTPSGQWWPNAKHLLGGN